jgi:hypothetical protein
MAEIERVSDKPNNIESKNFQVSATLKREPIEDLDRLGIDISSQLENEFAKELIKSKNEKDI